MALPTRTARRLTGLHRRPVRCENPNAYPAGVRVSEAEIDAINIQRHDFHGEWNYTIRPLPPVRSDSS
jgi:hypothetical protein